MGLLFTDNSPGPKIHVLLIGVGGYPFLKGGGSAMEQRFDFAKRIGQLSSPEHSVKAIYETIVSLHHRGSWVTPLGSIEVLLSTAEGTDSILDGQTLEHATIINIRRTYAGWRARCDRSRDNVAFLFYCGHGFEQGDQYLLAEDYGEDPNNPFLGAFNFTATRVAFDSCAAESQLFFIDSCRSITTDMLTHRIVCHPLDIPSQVTSNCRYDLTQRAAARNEKAQSKADESSYYTKALIKALEGGLSDKKGNDWVVSTGNLCKDMNSLIEIEKPGEGYKERCSTNYNGSKELLRHTKPPMVGVSVTCVPYAAHSLASLKCNNQETLIEICRDPDPDPWNFQTPAGIYTISAEFAPGGAYGNKAVPHSIIPPISEKEVKCDE